MSDHEYKARLGWQAGFYFFWVSTALLAFQFGLAKLFTVTNIAYVLVGTPIAAVLIGGLHRLISGIFEARANRRLHDITHAEMLMGSARIDQSQRIGRRLGWLFMANSIAFPLLLFAGFTSLIKAQ